MEQVCLYDSLSSYSLRKKYTRDSKDMTWIQLHPSKNHLKLVKLKDDKVKIPVINYYDFMDTKLYNGKQIDMDDLSECNKIELHAMEMNARISSVLFIPFRCISELKDTNNMFLNGFRCFLQQNSTHFEEIHKPILKNIQNCRNSMNAVRPPDSLEIVTKNEISDENDNEQNEELDEFLETYDMMLQNAEQFMKETTDCRSMENLLSIDTSIVL